MRKVKRTNSDDLKDIVIEKALCHVVFDGWSDVTLENVCLELDLSRAKMSEIFPRGAVDLALAFHQRDDEQFVEKFLVSKFNNSSNRIRDRIEFAINLRLEIAQNNKEAVKRSIALLTTPFHFSEGSKALWRTSDKIWTSIGDTRYDLNWYSKRSMLSLIYSTVVVYWLEDDSKNFVKTRGFITRRIADVMTVEKIKGTIKTSPILGQFVTSFELFASEMLERRESFPGWQHK
jgi:ubiquinone biosynthesis protein COQ9